MDPGNDSTKTMMKMSYYQNSGGVLLPLRLEMVVGVAWCCEIDAPNPVIRQNRGPELLFA